MFARAFSSSPVCRKCFASDAYARAIVRKSSATFRRCDRAGTAIVAFPSAWSVREMSRSTRDCNSTGWVFDESAENLSLSRGKDSGDPPSKRPAGRRLDGTSSIRPDPSGCAEAGHGPDVLDVNGVDDRVKPGRPRSRVRISAHRVVDVTELGIASVNRDIVDLVSADALYD